MTRVLSKQLLTCSYAGRSSNFSLPKFFALEGRWPRKQLLCPPEGNGQDLRAPRGIPWATVIYFPKMTAGDQRGKWGEEEINWEIRIDMYTLLSVKQITKKDLLYSTGNSVMTYVGKGSLK